MNGKWTLLLGEIMFLGLCLVVIWLIVRLGILLAELLLPVIREI